MTTLPSPSTWSLGTWPFDATTLMLTLHSAHRPDFVVDRGLVEEWADAAGSIDFQRVRTNAVGPAAADALMSVGFVVSQELDFLVAELTPARDTGPGDSHTVALRSGKWRIGGVRRTDAVRIDVAAFGDEWALDEVAFDNSCRATQRFRVRGARARTAVPFTCPVGYCLSGSSEDTSYLQRLAVMPTVRRRGVAAALLGDAMDWAARDGATRMFVNTDVDNRAALSLYQQWGFESVGYHLRVMECDRATLLPDSDR